MSCGKLKTERLLILFGFFHIQQKILCQVSAPDEVVLRIPLPNNVVGGDQPQPEMLRIPGQASLALGCHRYPVDSVSRSGLKKLW